MTIKPLASRVGQNLLSKPCCLRKTLKYGKLGDTETFCKFISFMVNYLSRKIQNNSKKLNNSMLKFET